MLSLFPNITYLPQFNSPLFFESRYFPVVQGIYTFDNFDDLENNGALKQGQPFEHRSKAKERLKGTGMF